MNGGANRTPTRFVHLTFDGALPTDANRVRLVPVSGVTARAQLPVAWLAHGTHRIEATYLGDSLFKGCATSVSHVVN